jgi:hypothetical protein
VQVLVDELAQSVRVPPPDKLNRSQVRFGWQSESVPQLSQVSAGSSSHPGNPARTPINTMLAKAILLFERIIDHLTVKLDR